MIDNGNYPTVLKNAKVTPVYKSGEKFLPTNYRPISVLPVLSKLLEKHISKHLYHYLSKYDLLHPAQSGFRPNHSCQTALQSPRLNREKQQSCLFGALIFVSVQYL